MAFSRTQFEGTKIAYLSIVTLVLAFTHPLQGGDTLWRKVTQEESDRMVSAIVEVVQKQDIKLFDQIADEEAYIDIGCKGYELEQKSLDNLHRAARRNKQLSTLFQETLKEVKSFGCYDYLTSREATDSLPHRIVFRQLDGAGVPKYHEWFLVHDKDNVLRIVDCNASGLGYSFAEGLWPLLETIQVQKSASDSSSDQQEASDCLFFFQTARKLITAPTISFGNRIPGPY